ncbi:MAG: hydrogenase iron-sulfur subunit [Chloroflexota bacterium]|nr:hydrogenase iron-sulfur subunit [Chloroflexota bacterium]
MAEFEPRIIAFACNWCTYAAADIAGTSRIQYPPNVRIIRVMCSGMVAPEHVSWAIENGADGVLVAGCHPGDCHYISGNLKAEEKFKMLKRVTDILGIEDERVKLKWIATSEGPIFAQTIEEMVQELKKLGPSPFKKAEESKQERLPATLEDIIQETKTYYCLECSKCTSICPVAKYDPYYSPRTMIESAMVELGNETIHDKKLFSCLGCYACSLRCPADVDYPAFTQKLRSLAFDAGEQGDLAHGGFLHSVVRLMSRSSYKQKRLEWLTKEFRTSDQSDILFFVGCAPYFEPVFEYTGTKTLDIPEASLKVLNRLGIEPMILPDEKCCGHDALWTGDMETFKMLAEHNTNLIREAGVKKIICACPEGYRTLKIDYPNYGFELDCEIQHISEFLVETIEKDGLRFKEIKKKVTYQDPCRLGRHLGVYDAPRKVLEAIPGIELVEMEHNREYSICCGTSAFTNCDAYSHNLRTDRLLEAKATGAEMLITACSKCQTHFNCAMNERGEMKGPDATIEVMDLANFIESALE